MPFSLQSYTKMIICATFFRILRVIPDRFFRDCGKLFAGIPGFGVDLMINFVRFLRKEDFPLLQNERFMKRIYLVLFCILGALRLHAQDFATDRIEFSLLTCSPSTEVYALYGHTAIRYRNETTGDDWAFNYGMFDFGTPNFIWRFTKGECDYELGIIPYDLMEYEYRRRGSAVYAQVLNLTAAEKEALYGLLMDNYRPENRKYRYNFLYDNCTTRARDRIEEAIDGEVVYSSDPQRVLSFRKIIHQYTAGSPWAEVGNDLCLGVAADRPISARQEMFAPFYMKDYASKAVIRTADGGERPLVLREETLVPLPDQAPELQGAERLFARVLTPAVIGWGLCLLTALLLVVQYRRNRIYWGVDVFFQVLVALMGCVVTFLFFFSEHPTVGTNWQILLLNPLPLLFLPRIVWCAVHRRKTRIHAAYAGWLMFFMIFSLFTPQDFCTPVVSLACVLFLRSVGYILYYKKNQIK